MIIWRVQQTEVIIVAVQSLSKATNFRLGWSESTRWLRGGGSTVFGKLFQSLQLENCGWVLFESSADATLLIWWGIDSNPLDVYDCRANFDLRGVIVPRRSDNTHSTDIRKLSTSTVCANPWQQQRYIAIWLLLELGDTAEKNMIRFNVDTTSSYYVINNDQARFVTCRPNTIGWSCCLENT